MRWICQNDGDNCKYPAEAMASAALLERAQAISNSDKDKGIELYSKIGEFFGFFDN